MVANILLSFWRACATSAVGAAGYSSFQPRPRLFGKPDFKYGFRDRSFDQQVARRDPARRSGAWRSEPALQRSTPGAWPRLFTRRKNTCRSFNRIEFGHADRYGDK